MAVTEVVSKSDELYPKDVVDIVFILESTKEETRTQSDRLNFISSSSNIVSQNKRNVWEGIEVRCHVVISTHQIHNQTKNKHDIHL